MKFGTRDGVLRQPWEKVFEEAARLGFDGVELDIGGDYANTMFWNADGRGKLRACVRSPAKEKKPSF